MFWLKRDDGPWVEVDKAEYVREERSADFRNTLGRPDEPATAAFSSYWPGRGVTIRGTTINPLEG